MKLGSFFEGYTESNFWRHPVFAKTAMQAVSSLLRRTVGLSCFAAGWRQLRPSNPEPYAAGGCTRALMDYVRVLERVAELAIFGAAIWPLLRICANRGFRQKLHAFPWVALVIVSALSAYFLTVVFVWRYVPGILPIAAFLVCGAMVYAWWRARPGYGAARGLPPGSLALAPIAPWKDYLFYQKQAERYGPVFKMSHFAAPMVCIVGLKQAKKVLHTYDEDLSVPPVPATRFIPRGLLRCMDAEVHQEYAAIFHATFTRTVIEECEPYTAQAVRHGLSTMAKACVKNPAFGAHPEEHIRGILFVVFMRMFFCLTPETHHFERMRALYQVIDYRNSWRTPNFRVVRALDELVAIVVEIGEKASGCFLAEALRVEATVLRDRTFVLNSAVHYVVRIRGHRGIAAMGREETQRASAMGGEAARKALCADRRGRGR